jgi:hypothetical protein
MFISGMSIILGGIVWPLYTYSRNQPIIKSYRQTWGKFGIFDKEFTSVPNLIRNGVAKKRYVIVSISFVVLFSLLPIFKNLLVQNPWLFRLRLHFTNHWTTGFENTAQQVNSAFAAYVTLPNTDPKKIPSHYRFAPNLDLASPKKLKTNKYSAFGLQLIPWIWGCLINLYANPDFAELKFEKLNHGHRFLVDTGDKLTRYNLLQLIAHYDNPFYVFTSYVEINLRLEDKSIEHPMYGLATESLGSKFAWDGVDTLFRGSVAGKFAEYLR